MSSIRKFSCNEENIRYQWLFLDKNYRVLENRKFIMKPESFLCKKIIISVYILRKHQNYVTGLKIFSQQIGFS